MKFTRTDWKYLVDTLMFLCMLGIIGVGLVMAFVIPEGRLGAGQSKYFLGVHRHQWGDIHLYLSLAFTAFVIVHIVLAWSWVKGKTKGLFGKAWKAVVGAVVLAAVAVPFIFWLAASKDDPAYAQFGEGLGGGQGRRSVEARPLEEGRHDQAPPAAAYEAPAAGREQGAEAVAAAPAHDAKAVAGRMEAGEAEVVVTGQMTLRDVERATGISARDLAAKLRLPAGVSLDETLGRLRRSYGFAMEDVRDAVEELLKAKRAP